MTFFKYIAVAVVLLTAAGCDALLPPLKLSTPDPVSGQVWVVSKVTGGQQCRDTGFVPPDLAEVLEGNGIEVHEERIEPMPVCEACVVCPAYAARHFYRINGSDLSAAERLGFERSAPPSGTG